MKVPTHDGHVTYIMTCNELNYCMYGYIRTWLLSYFVHVELVVSVNFLYVASYALFNKHDHKFY